MSLLSIISNYTSGSSSTASPAIIAAQARLAIAQAEKEAAPVTPSSAVQISDAALLAQAGKADRAKDFAVLASEVRATIDKQYAAGADQPKLDPLSGRALAAVALNQNDKFSRQEQAAARAELKSREREALAKALSTGMSVANLAGYGKILADRYEAASPEERRVLGYTQQTRLNAAKMASTSSVSLFNEPD